MNRSLLTTLAVLLIAALPATAAAATSPLLDQYGNPVGTDTVVTTTPEAIATATPEAAPVENAAPVEDAAPVENAVASESATPTAATANQVGALPFTGSELSLLFFAGAALLGSGFILRRVGFAKSKRNSA